MNLVILPLMVAAAHAAAPVALEAAAAPAAPVAVAEEAGDRRKGKRESYHTIPQLVPR